MNSTLFFGNNDRNTSYYFYNKYFKTYDFQNLKVSSSPTKWIRRHLKKPPPHHVLIIYIGLSLVDTIRGRSPPFGYAFSHLVGCYRGHSAPFDVGQTLMKFLLENLSDYCDTAIEICRGSNVRSRAGRRAWGGAREREREAPRSESISCTSQILIILTAFDVGEGHLWKLARYFTTV